MDTGPADDAVYLALTVGVAAALTVTLRLRDRRAPPRHGLTAAAGTPPLLPPALSNGSRRRPPTATGPLGERPPGAHGNDATWTLPATANRA